MNLPDAIRAIQRATGQDPDGIFGPLTAAAVLRVIRAQDPHDGQIQKVDGIDARSEAIFATLDAKARPMFEDFLLRAKATAATYGCDYVAIGGTRTWAEQEELYALGRTAPGRKVTNARPGYSWHNYGVAIDFGVFRGKAYLDNTDAPTAHRVHAACAVHAKDCGLAWGGHWKRMPDIPHYQLAMLPVSPEAADRETFKRKGSVL